MNLETELELKTLLPVGIAQIHDTISSGSSELGKKEKNLALFERFRSNFSKFENVSLRNQI